MILYYGADSIVTKPVFGKGNPSNDYGLGFYLTPNEIMAKLWASRFSPNGYLIKYELDEKKLNILYLNTNTNIDVLKWITLLVSHRFSKDAYAQNKATIDWLKNNYYPNIEQYDMVVGYRADDSYFKYSEEFVTDNLSLEKLEEAMKLGKLGLQYVLMSKKAFNSIKYISHKEVKHTDEYEKFRYETLQQYKSIKDSDSINNTFIRDIMRNKL